jgi:hypothetical protein
VQKIGSFHGSFLSKSKIRLAPAVKRPRVQAAMRPAGPAPQTTTSYRFEVKFAISGNKLAFIYEVFFFFIVICHFF